MKIGTQEWLDLEAELDDSVNRNMDKLEDFLNERLDELVLELVENLNKDITEEQRQELLFKARESFFRG